SHGLWQIGGRGLDWHVSFPSPASRHRSREIWRKSHRPLEASEAALAATPNKRPTSHLSRKGPSCVLSARLSPEEARRSARACFETMQSLGLKPVAFAYPTGHASRQSTRDAVRDAGFVSARIFRASSRREPYIVPGETRAPDDWYALPSLVIMGR